MNNIERWNNIMVKLTDDSVRKIIPNIEENTIDEKDRKYNFMKRMQDLIATRGLDI